MKKSALPDPFTQARQEKGYGEMVDQDDPVVMVLRHKDLRKCAHNWKTFQSGAKPGRIVVPSEEKIRETRQIPFELDPPVHGAYRKLVEPWFRRALESEYESRLLALVEKAVETGLQRGAMDIVSEFALPLQSKALTLLLNIPLEEANVWIDWGTHVFRSEDTALDGDKAKILYDYIDQQIDRAKEAPGDDLYSVLLASEVDGRKLTKEEVKGVMILTFAGGRDTIINAVTNTIAYLADHPESIQRLREEPEITRRAVEELIRYFSPLTHMGRVVTEDTHVCEHAVQADSRISLCWAAANRDETVFDNPNEVQLDRKRNPHVGFGFSHHNCLGAHHARQLLKCLLMTLAQKVASIELIEANENIEVWGEFQRKVGFDRLSAKFHSRTLS